MKSHRQRRKKYTHEMIRSRHQGPGPLPLVLVLDHLKAGFNVAKLIRSANAFGAREVHLVGVPPFDISPAMGALRHTLTRSFETFAESHAWLRREGYSIFCLEVDAPLQVGNCALPEKSAFVLGHEEFGLSFNPKDYEGIHGLRIAQYGRVQSLNVSVAGSIVAFEYTRQHGYLVDAVPVEKRVGRLQSEKITGRVTSEAPRDLGNS